MDIERYPKILIGCPTYKAQAYTFDEFFEAITNLDYPNFDLLIVENSDTDEYYEYLKSKGINTIKLRVNGSGREIVGACRELMRKKALEKGYDYLLCVDQDIIIPNDTLKKLLKHKKEIASALCFTRMKKGEWIRTIPAAFVQAGDIPGVVTYLPINEALKDQFIEVTAVGFGCILLSRSVLGKIPLTYDTQAKCGEDILFCIRAREAGLNIYVDTSVKCKHNLMGHKNKWVERPF